MTLQYAKGLTLCSLLNCMSSKIFQESEVKRSPEDILSRTKFTLFIAMDRVNRCEFCEFFFIILRSDIEHSLSIIKVIFVSDKVMMNGVLILTLVETGNTLLCRCRFEPVTSIMQGNISSRVS